MKCPRCGNTDIVKLGKHRTLRGRKQRYLCLKGHTFYDKNDYAKKSV